MFLADGELVALCDSYYPAGLARGTQIAQDRRIRGEVRAVIEDPAGPVRRRIARSFDDLTSRMPRGGVVLLPQGVPVTRVLRMVFGTGDVLVEVQDAAAAGRHEFRYEVSLNGDGGPGPR